MEELKKWLVLNSSSPEKEYQLIGPVDEMWHTFLLFTKKYHDFCKELGGFIHHVPTDPFVIKEARKSKDSLDLLNQDVKNGYELFLADYQEMYGTKPNRKFWPKFTNPYGADTDPGGCGGSYGGCGTKDPINPKN